MKKTIKAGLLFAFAVIAGQAHAADIYGRSTKDTPDGVSVAVADTSARSWTQIFAGIGGACETGTTELDAPEFLNFQGIGSSGCSFAPFVGADLQIPNSRLVVGVEGEYRWGNDESSLTIGNRERLEASATIDSSWLLSARAGALLDKDTLLYARFGFGQAEGSWDIAEFCNDNLIGKASGDLPTFDVIAYGVGLEHRFLDGHGAVRVEYRHLDFSEESVGGNVTIQPSFDQGLVGVVYRH